MTPVGVGAVDVLAIYGRMDDGADRGKSRTSGSSGSGVERNAKNCVSCMRWRMLRSVQHLLAAREKTGYECSVVVAI